MADVTHGPLVWMDMEMSGLNPETDVILEIATVVTDAELNIIAKGPEIIIHQSEAVIKGMDEWNTSHHGSSGLSAAVLTSKVSVAEAEHTTLDFIKKHCKKNASPLCGNSIWQDRRFLRRYMQEADAYLHYRNVDVSTLKELFGRWYGEPAKFRAKKESHRAMDDILESIDELKFYRENFLK